MKFQWWFCITTAFLLLFTRYGFAVSSKQIYDAKLEKLQEAMAHSTDSEQIARSLLEMGITMCFPPEGDCGEGITSLRSLIKQYPDTRWTDDALWYLAKVYQFHLYDYEQVISTYCEMLEKYKVVRLEPRIDSSYQLPSDITASQITEEIDLLQTSLRRMEALKGEIKTASQPRDLITAYFNLAELYRRLGNFPQALDTYKALAKRFPSSHIAAQAAFECGEIYFLDRVALLNQQRLYYSPSVSTTDAAYRQAISLYKKVLENFPDNQWKAFAVYRIGECYLQLKEYSRAKEAFERVVREYPGSLYAEAALCQLSELERGEHPNSIVEDYLECREVVRRFCESWRNKDYEMMHRYLYQARQEKKNQVALVGADEEDYRVKNALLKQYFLFPLIAVRNRIIVEVNLEFTQKVSSREVSGINRFEIVKVQGDWKIAELQSPITPLLFLNNFTGSHPGE